MTYAVPKVTIRPDLSSTVPFFISFRCPISNHRDTKLFRFQKVVKEKNKHHSW